MYKVPFYMKFSTLLITLLMIILLVIMTSNVLTDNYWFILIILLVVYMVSRAIKYLYQMYKSDFTTIINIEKGLLLNMRGGEMTLEYKDIESISIQEIGIFKGIITDKVIIQTHDFSVCGFITKGTEFQNTIPASITVNRLENKYFKW